MQAFPYLFGYLIPLLAAAGIYFGGPLWPYAALLLAFGVIPPIEALAAGTAAPRESAQPGCLPGRSPEPGCFGADRMSEPERHGRSFDFTLYLSAPVQYALVIYLLLAVSQGRYQNYAELAGWILSVGLSCGMLGINSAHELGHRPRGYEQWLAQALLLTSLYMHFFIEHNRGHHRHVATPLDPATARKGEYLYTFWPRSIAMSFVSAWRLEAKRLRNSGQRPYGLRNRMWLYVTLQAGTLAVIYGAFGGAALAAFALAALTGILLLETINYVEHYGLLRKFDRTHNRYEKVRPHHSWNSNHLLGRLLLFELPRHSDHHAFAARRYQDLRHFDASPQMPAGYPAMVLLALVPPLWQRVMDPRLQQTASSTRP
jgi:alkane 1-monooxygenase